MKLLIYLIGCLAGIIALSWSVAHLELNPLILVFALNLVICGLSLLFSEYTLLIKLMIVIVFFVPFQYFEILNPLKVINPLTILCVIMGAKYARDLATKRLKTDWGLFDLVYLAMLASASVSALSAESVLGAGNWVFHSLVTGYLIYKVMSTMTKEQVLDILDTLILVATASAVFGIIQYVLKIDLIYGYFTGRLTSFLRHPLINALMFALVLPWAGVFYLRTKRFKYLLCFVVLLVAIVLTYARGSWLGLTLGLGCLFFLMPARPKLSILIFALTFFTVIGLTAPLRQGILNRLEKDESARFGSINMRLALIPMAVRLTKERPFFGVGPYNSGRFVGKYAYSKKLGEKSSFENTYLGMLVDLGFVGFLLLHVLYGSVFFNVARACMVRGPDNMSKYASLAALVVLFSAMATFNFDSSRVYHFVIWFYLAAASVLIRPDGKGRTL